MTRPWEVGSPRLQRWTRDESRDVYGYHYSCGHTIEVLSNAMQRGGQVVPPLCPTCHGEKVIDKMEWANWQLNPKWEGFIPGTYEPGASVIRSYNFIPQNGGPLAWLDYQIGVVRGRAWK